MRKTSDRGSMTLKTRREGKYNSSRMSSKTKNLMDALSTRRSFTLRNKKENPRDRWSSSWKTREDSRRRSVRRMRI
jgi:hypothetical protein